MRALSLLESNKLRLTEPNKPAVIPARARLRRRETPPRQRQRQPPLGLADGADMARGAVAAPAARPAGGALIGRVRPAGAPFLALQAEGRLLQLAVLAHVV